MGKVSVTAMLPDGTELGAWETHDDGRHELAELANEHDRAVGGDWRARVIETVQAREGTYGAHKRKRRRIHLERELAELVPKVAETEADMRRAFKRWEKVRARCARIERELDRLANTADVEGL